MNITLHIHPLLFVIFIFTNMLVMGGGALVLTDKLVTDWKRFGLPPLGHTIALVGMLTSFFTAMILLVNGLVQ